MSECYIKGIRVMCLCSVILSFYLVCKTMSKKDAMGLLFVCMAVQLFFLFPSTNAAENDSCIRTYKELRRALHDNETNNIATLLNAFYPPNSQDIQVAIINYCISDNKTFCTDIDNENDFTFKWAASALLLVQEYDLINALVFDLFQFNYTNITLIISPLFCEDVNEDDITNNLQLLTTWLQFYAHRSHGYNEKILSQGFAVHLDTEDKEQSFDITVYDTVEKLHYSLLVLQFVLVIIIVLTLLFQICSNSFANEIDMKVDKVSKSFSRISNFIKGINKDMYQKKNSKSSKKKSWENTLPYLVLLVAFIVWDSMQYHKAEKISKYEWILFFPIPCIAPTFIIISMGISILLFAWYCRHIIHFSHTCSKNSKKHHEKHKEYQEIPSEEFHIQFQPNNNSAHVPKTENKSEAPNDVAVPVNDVAVPVNDSANVPTNEDNSEARGDSCTCRIRDIVHFPILTGLGVFLVYHGSWMLLIFSAYANIVIIKSLFLLPLFFFVIALLPRFIKDSSKLFINWCYQSEVFTKCMKCMKRNKSSTKCTECKKCKDCTICDEHLRYNCNKCIKCDTCKQRKECQKDPEDMCPVCQKCKCDQCKRCKHCKQCTLCNDCKNCEDCKQCFSCKLRNRFKLCIKCMEKRQKNNRNTIAIYGFSVTVLIAIPLLLVIHYASDYILLVTDIHDDPLKLFLALIVIVGVPYYLILLWDSGNDKNDGNDNKLIIKFEDRSWRLILDRENAQLHVPGSQP